MDKFDKIWGWTKVIIGMLASVGCICGGMLLFSVMDIKPLDPKAVNFIIYCHRFGLGLIIIGFLQMFSAIDNEIVFSNFRAKMRIKRQHEKDMKEIKKILDI
jgi:hypothetical protein